MQLTNVINSTTHNFFMVDIETSGLSPCKNDITSICIVEFHPVSGAIIDKLHFGFSHVLPERVTDINTMRWRKENNVDIMERDIRTVSVKKGLEEISNFLLYKRGEKEPVIFANHTEFDIAFLKSYYDKYEIQVPWKHSKVFELNSYLLGRNVVSKSDLYVEVLESARWANVLSLHFEGTNKAHDAFYDCVLQIELLMRASR